MCDFLSGFLNIQTGAMAWGDLVSHSRSADLLKIDQSQESSPWRELEWTDDKPDSLVVRTIPTDAMTTDEARSLVLAKYPRRIDLIATIFANPGKALPSSLTSLYLNGAKSPDGQRLGRSGNLIVPA